MYRGTYFLIRIISQTIASVIIGIIAIFAGRGRSYNNRGMGRYSRYNYRSYGLYDGELDNDESIGSKINAGSRRRTALASCKKFLSTSDSGCYTLKNAHVIFSYNTSLGVFKCRDRKNQSKNLTVVWEDQSDYEANYENNKFNEIFDYICSSFDEKSSYNGISNVLKKYFKVEENHPPVVPKKSIAQDESFIITNTESDSMPTIEPVKKLDINSASEEEISKLPGITIILAKKIINYRKEHAGFKDLNEFFQNSDIQPHIQEKIKDFICIKPYKNISIQNTNNDRIIDI